MPWQAGTVAETFALGRLVGRLMGRAYAGTLGPLAFACIVARGVAVSSGVEETLATASAALFVFAMIGYIVGQLAEHLVNESVRKQFQAAMAAWEAKHPTTSSSKPRPKSEPSNK
jgi:hypothetical protein